jgi:lipopolysaccharide transport system ATP-binding protein
MNSIAVRVDQIGKRYRLGTREKYQTLRDKLAQAVQAPFRRKPSNESAGSFWALKDVSFEIGRGEVLGIIGGNGAGKSTLLKVLSRITSPTEGTAEVHGRIGSLLEVGTGFHPELTGRENIYLNGAILGMRKTEIERHFDDIVSFAEVERFVDTPVKHYSSGMYMRLAFSVAAHLDPEILLIDEVLAVGDTAFQKKCLSRMDDVARQGRTILFVSHNLVAVESLCTRVVLLQHGRVGAVGPTREIINRYLSQSGSGAPEELSRKHRNGSGEIRFTSVEVVPAEPGESPVIRAGDGFEVRLGYKASTKILRPTFSIAIFNSMSVQVFGIHTTDLNFEINAIDKDGRIALRIVRPNLMPGRYLLHIAVGDAVNAMRYDHIIDAAELEIQPADVYGTGRLGSAEWTIVFLDSYWRMLETDGTSGYERSEKNSPVPVALGQDPVGR